MTSSNNKESYSEINKSNQLGLLGFGRGENNESKSIFLSPQLEEEVSQPNKTNYLQL